MASVPTGTIFSVATAFGPSKTVTGISNAVEAVVSATAHGFAVGDIIQLYSGWGRLNRRVVRVKSMTADNFVAEGIDTTNLEFFPTGSGGGTARKVTTFQQINKILNPNNSGGEAKNVTVKFLESDVEENINDGFTAITETFDIDADEFGKQSYAALVSLSEVQTDTVLKKALKNGSLIFTPCRVALNENVRMSDGSIMVNSVAINGNGRITRYQAA
ncbi:phage tail tube protein [Neopusillimonas aromaticivorans]|uniref:phage tail tube protein n=1 Tax=Neopusillimonas aromaticivorans TaxID=2979868 RepID=UPI002592DA69|nr:phage tail tube protein [Neopusillimonas aromaticivorans]WJJ93996.1 phage tail tube protein [Neopusillimonas aromaticivorans]